LPDFYHTKRILSTSFVGHTHPDGILEISDGVTRATRIAKLAPGQTVPIVVIGQYRRSRPDSPCVRDRL